MAWSTLNNFSFYLDPAFGSLFAFFNYGIRTCDVNEHEVAHSIVYGVPHSTVCSVHLNSL